MGSTCRLRREPQASLTARRERPCRQRLGIPIGCHHETSGDGMGNSGAVAGRVMARRIGPRRSGRPQEIRNPLFARVYDHVLSRGESARMVGYRQQLLEGLAGKVIEIGPGNGPNFPHYPPAVAEVVAVEPEPYLRARAQRAAHQARSQVSVIDGDADHLPAGNASVDAVVVCQVLCSVPDQTGALREILRVLTRRAPFLASPFSVCVPRVARGCPAAVAAPIEPHARLLSLKDRGAVLGAIYRSTRGFAVQTLTRISAGSGRGPGGPACGSIIALRGRLSGYSGRQRATIAPRALPARTAPSRRTLPQPARCGGHGR